MRREAAAAVERPFAPECRRMTETMKAKLVVDEYQDSNETMESTNAESQQSIVCFSGRANRAKCPVDS